MLGFNDRQTMSAIETGSRRVTADELMNLAGKPNGPMEYFIDPFMLAGEGELSLWAHTLSRDDNWVLCGLDRACLRCGVKLKLSERLVSLEELLINIGYQPKTTLRDAYTRKWHKSAINDYFLAEFWGNRRQN